jgi:hypothetical protein
VPATAGKGILSAPTPGAVVGTPTAVAALPVAAAKMTGTVVGVFLPVAETSQALVGREVKASMECAPVVADDAVSKEVVTAPVPAIKGPGPFHLTSVVVEILGTEVGDQGCSCEEQASNCGEVMAEDVVVRLWNVQIQVEGWEEMAIAAYWVTDGIDCCRVSFLPGLMVRHAAC